MIDGSYELFLSGDYLLSFAVLGLLLFALSIAVILLIWLLYDLLWCLYIDSGDSEPLMDDDGDPSNFAAYIFAGGVGLFGILCVIGFAVQFPVFSAVAVTTVSLIMLTKFVRVMYKSFNKHKDDRNAHG